MSSSYTPTSNWTDRGIKGRSLDPKPLRPTEPVSFRTDPAADRLSRQLTDDVRRTRQEPAPQALAEDDVLNQPMVNAIEPGSDVGGDIFDAPMINSIDEARADDGVLDAPLAAAATPSARAEVIEPRFEAGPASTPAYTARQGGGSRAKLLMVAAPVALVAAIGVGWLAFGQGQSPAPAVEPESSVQIAAASPAPAAGDSLINMPVSDASAPAGQVIEAPAAASVASAPVTPRPERTAPARPAAAPATEEASAPVIAAEPAAESPTISTEPVAPAPEASEPLISTEPLTTP